MFIAVVSRSSSRSARPVQAASAPMSATARADEPAMPGTDRRLRPRPDVQAPRAEVTDEAGQQRQSIDAERGEIGRVDLLPGVLRNEDDAVVPARGQRAVGPEADCGVDRLCMVVEQIERPDVVGATGQIDAGRRRGVDAHPRIIMASECRFGSFGVTSVAWPSWVSADTACPPSCGTSSRSSISAASSTSRATSVEPRQVAELSREVAALAPDWPLWISVDQEGGRVARLKAPFTEWPPALTLGRSGRDELAARFAAALGAELRAVGITLDFAPVLDVHTNPANPVIGDRALGDRAEVVARLGAIIIDGLQAGGRGGLRQALPGPRRHDRRFARGAARRGARPPPARRGRARAVPRARLRRASRRS